MARGNGKRAATQIPGWPTERKDEVALVHAAAAGDPAACAEVLGYLYDAILWVACKELQGHKFPCTEDAKGEIRDFMLDWLETKRTRGKAKGHTGWEILGDYQGDAALPTFLRNWILGWAREYCRRETERREAVRLHGGGGGGETGGRAPDEPLLPRWTAAQVRVVRGASDDPTHRLAFYLGDLAKCMPPPEEVAAAADAMGVSREGLGERIVRLRILLLEKELERDAVESRLEQRLTRKRLRLRALEEKRARGNTLRQSEVRALRKLPEEIPQIEAKLEAHRRRCAERPVGPSLQEIRDVLYPEEGIGVDRTTIGSWIKTMETRMARSGGSGRAKPASGNAPKKGRGPAPPNQQTPPSNRPSDRRSS